MEDPGGNLYTEIDSWLGFVAKYAVCLLVFSSALWLIVANPLGSAVARPSGDRRATELLIVCHTVDELIKIKHTPCLKIPLPLLQS